ncbi:hypothetical protein JI664_01185 [Rhodobacter sp. NTK016B]|uniref:hypothetical protein n=1 Tax=Rhodobacter sp. NTK016B TaxID=2759676 RepID=UPI001A8DB801|nr:hypothetical protein [Rhodobacter sp. NTK016B]MBN8290567.1 hypothetical protein [Rhodobacter sp. NTK016B]
MSERANFSVRVKQSLSERVGYRCSFPGCDAITIGPSAETPTSSSKSGMACHIYAATDGPSARRVSPDMTPAQLSAFDNGIWMCYRHGKIIDADECTYTPDLLKDWRRLAERKAELRHKLGRELTPEDLDAEALAAQAIVVTTPDFAKTIAEVIDESGMESIWGKEASFAARDAAIEIARNALTHGSATHVRLQVTAHSFELLDDGIPFSLSDLEMARNPRGGAHAVAQLRRHAPGVILSHTRQDTHNRFIMVSSHALDESLETHPCSTMVNGGPSSVKSAMIFIEERPECDTIFLRPSSGILSYSDLYNLKSGLTTHGLTKRDIALVLGPHSEGIRDFLAKEMPYVRLIEK